MERKELDAQSDIEAIRSLMSVEGLDLVDIGCGAGATTRELVDMGARVLGVEPDPVQAARNREAEAVPGLTFAEAGAADLPVESGTVDGVFFFRSLHHVPAAEMDAALAEAARVLKPGTGFLCVVEPGMEGTHFPVMRPFHDETRVRSKAQAALARIPQDRFASRSFYRWVQHPRYPDFETMADRFASMSFNDIRREDVETPEVRELFEQGRTGEGEYVFDQPMLLNLYKGLC